MWHSGTVSAKRECGQRISIARPLVSMPKRRLDDRIRELCAKVGAASNRPDLRHAEMEALLQELLGAIHQKVERIRILAAKKLLQPADTESKDVKERRAGRS